MYLTRHLWGSEQPLEFRREQEAVLDLCVEERLLAYPEIIAELVQEAEKAPMAIVLERMRAKGLLFVAPWSSQSTPTDFKPISVQGKPLSEVIIEERR